MSTADALVDLIVRYEEMVQGGQAPTPEEICIDFPELLEEFQQRIEELQKNRGFFDSTEDGEYAHTTNASLGGGDCEALPQIPGFHVLDKLGQGGMGLVLLVHEPSLNRRLALKILPRRQGRNPESVRQFVDEAQIAGQLQHPGIPPIHQLGDLDGQPYFTMKLIKGQTLAKLLKENDPRVKNESWYTRVFEQVCQTLAYAHSHKVIHRDLKPANIMVGDSGEVLLMDWGLAKVLTDEDSVSKSPEIADSPGTVIRTTCPVDDLSASKAGWAKGTFPYMPPEQALGALDRVGKPSDVFGLGAILCEFLTGKPPYLGSEKEIIVQAAAGRVEPAFERLDESKANEELIELARRCLNPRQDQRPQDAGEVASAVRAYLDGAQERLRAEQINRAAAEARVAAELHAKEQAEARAFAEERAREAAEARALAEQQARAEAEGRVLAEERAREAAEARALAEQQARAEAEGRAREERRRRRLTLALASIVFVIAVGAATVWVVREHTVRKARAFEDALAKGKAFYHKSDLAQAIKWLKKAVELAPENVQALSHLAYAFHDQQQLNQAIDCYREAIKLDRTLLNAHVKLGDALYDMNDRDAAIRHYQAAIELGQDGRNLAIGRIAEAQTLRRDGKFDEAAKVSRVALALNLPGFFQDRDDFLHRAQDYLKYGSTLEQDLDAALKELGELGPERQGPAIAEKYLALAERCRLCNKRHLNAVTLYKKAFELWPRLARPSRRRQPAYHAACAAVIASFLPVLDSVASEKSLELRHLARRWLQDDLTSYKQIASGDLEDSLRVIDRLSHWSKDSQLADVRDQLSKLTEEEGKAWRPLWADVADILVAVQKRFVETGHIGSLTVERPQSVHEVVLTAGTYVIDLESSQFETRLLIPAADSDRGNSDPGGRVTFTAVKDGKYPMTVGSYQQRAVGAYVLRVRKFVGADQ